MSTLLITGGAGFIGSKLVRHVLETTTDDVVVVDKLTYAASQLAVETVLRHPRVHFIRADIADQSAMSRVFLDRRPSAVLNLAAETHVDRSIDRRGRSSTRTSAAPSCCWRPRAGSFGSSSLRRARRVPLPARLDRRGLRHTRRRPASSPKRRRMRRTRRTPPARRRPTTWCAPTCITYGLPTLITNCSNNYGPFQHPEKLIPLMILNALEGRPLPIYGDGGTCATGCTSRITAPAILLVLRTGASGRELQHRRRRTSRPISTSWTGSATRSRQM